MDSEREWKSEFEFKFISKNPKILTFLVVLFEDALSNRQTHEQVLDLNGRTGRSRERAALNDATRRIELSFGAIGRTVVPGDHRDFGDCTDRGKRLAFSKVNRLVVRSSFRVGFRL